MPDIIKRKNQEEQERNRQPEKPVFIKPANMQHPDVNFVWEDPPKHSEIRENPVPLPNYTGRKAESTLLPSDPNEPIRVQKLPYLIDTKHGEEAETGGALTKPPVLSLHKAMDQAEQAPAAPRTIQKLPELSDVGTKITRAPALYGAVSPYGKGLAAVIALSTQKPDEAKRLFKFMQTSEKDPSSPYYRPYARPTNKMAMDELLRLGIDTSNIDEKWFQENAWLKQHARLGAAGMPKLPTKKSSREETAAYYYLKLADGEMRTRKAEEELQGLRHEIGYWAARRDRNYSDEEILQRIDWNKYPTLTMMREGQQKGRPTPLNRAVDFDSDTVFGMLWSARNGNADGSSTIKAARYALGEGRQYEPDDFVRAMRDPASSAYNPYALGSTVDEAAEYFGVDSFDEKWLNDNRDILASGNETAIRHYMQVNDAEQFTLQAEEEARKLSERLNAGLNMAVSAGGNIDANVLLKDALIGLNALQRMDGGLISGNPAKLTRPVRYRWRDIAEQVSGQVQMINARQNAPHDPAQLEQAARNEAEKVIKGQGTLIQKDAVPKSYTSFREKMPGLWAAGLAKNPLSAGWYVPAGGVQSGFGPGLQKVQAIAGLRKAGDLSGAAAQEYDALTGPGVDVSKLSTNEGAVRMAAGLALDSARAFTPQQFATPGVQDTNARYDAVVNSILGIDADAVAQILPQILHATTMQGDIQNQAAGTTGLLSSILRLGEDALKTVTDHVLGEAPALQTVQTMFRVLKLRDMENGSKPEALKTAEAALRKAAGNALQAAAAQTGHEELDDLTSIANQSSHNLDAILDRWGLQGVNYIGNLLQAGRGDLASAIHAMPTYAKSAIVAETNMRTFGVSDAVIAAQDHALQADMKSPIVVLSAKEIAKRQAVEARKAELHAGGAAGVPSILLQKVNEAGKNVNQSKPILHQAVRNEQAGKDALAKAQALFRKNMADSAAADAMAAAVERFQKAIAARAKAEKELKNSQQTLNDAQQKLEDAKKQAEVKVDEQAEQDVYAMRMKLAEARAKLMEKAMGAAGKKQLWDIKDAAPDGSLHLSGKSLQTADDHRNENVLPPMQSVDLPSARQAHLANDNGSGIIKEGRQQLESDDAAVPPDKGNMPLRALAASGAVTDVGYASGAGTAWPQNATSENTAEPSTTLAPSSTAGMNAEAGKEAGDTGSSDGMAAGAGNNPYSHMGILDADYQAYLDGKLTEADLLIIANAAQMYQAAGGSGNASYLYQNEAHKRAADIREKYDPDYKKNDTYDYTHGGKYNSSSSEPMPGAPPYKTWTKLTAVDSPLGKAFSKAIEPIKENVEAGVQLSDFFKQYDSSSSARVQTILADTRKKLNGKSLTAKDMLSIQDNARSAIDDTSMFQLIGNNVWYQDQAYPLYDPRNYQDGPYFQPVYTKVTDGIDISSSFDWKNALGSLALEDDNNGSLKFYTKGQGILILLANILPIIEDNYHVNDVSVVLETTGGGHNRAYLKVGSSDRQKKMDEYAGKTQSYVSNAWSKGNGFGLFGALDNVAALYESVSGEKADRWLDLQMTLDPKRKGDPCYAYIVGEEEGDILYASPIYPGDRLEIVDFWGKGFVYDLTDKIDPLYIVKGGMDDLKASLNNIEKKKSSQ